MALITWNPNDKDASITLSNNNMTADGTAQKSARATEGKSSGKWYWEVVTNSNYPISGYIVMGVGSATANLAYYPGHDTNGRGYYGYNGYGGYKYSSGQPSAYGPGFVAGDTIGMALDMDLGTLTFYKNGISQGVAFTDLLTLGTVYPMIGLGQGATGSWSVTVNFGNTFFKYPIPEGYQAYDIDHIVVIRTDVADMEIGDFIPCRYTAASAAAGVFSELGNCSTTDIPINGAAAPDGRFYFIKVDKGLLIADRVVQNSISWNVLNVGKLIQGCLVKLHDLSDVKLQDVKSVTPTNAYSGNPSWDVLFDNIKVAPAEYWLQTYVFNNTNQNANAMVIELNSPTIINNYVLYAWHYGSSASQYNEPISWKFLGSSDGVNWTLLDTGSNNWIANGSTYSTTRVFANSTAYKFYKFDQITAVGWPSLLEIELFNSSLCLARSLTGGCAYTDANGDRSVTDQGIGGWPVNNEWDKYIAKSNLNGKIMPGDISVWHWGTSTWCQDTPILALVGAGYRIMASPTDLVKRYFYDTNFAGVNGGFRPVLQYKEDGSLLF